MKHLKKKYINGDHMACGQYSIAMATGKKFGEIINAVGHVDSMSVNGIKATLSKLGYEAVPAKERSGGGIVIIESEDRELGHAMAWEGDSIYDPDDFPYEDFAHMERKLDDIAWEVTHLWRVVPVKTREWAVGSAK